MKRFIIIISFLYIIAAFSACGNSVNSADENENVKEATAHENEGAAELTEEQVKSVGIAFGSIEQKELKNSVKANGILTVPNQNKAFVVPLYSGVIKSLNVQPGSFVKKGQAVATIVNPGLLQMQQQLQQVNTQIALSEIEVKRQKELVEGNAAPLKRLQQVETELSTLKSQRTGLQKQLAAIGASQGFSPAIVVRAPISGTISKVSAQLGSNVDASTPIAEIVNNSQLHLDLYVYEKDIPKLKADQTIHFTLTNSPGKEYDAQIYSIGTAFENNSKTISVHAKVSGDKDGLIDGMNITALVSLYKSTVPAVPTDAIVNYQGKDYIFIVSADSSRHGDHQNTAAGKGKKITFEKIPVAKGTTDVGYSEVTLLKEVPPAASIVTKGAFFILAKMTNTGEHED